MQATAVAERSVSVDNGGEDKKKERTQQNTVRIQHLKHLKKDGRARQLSSWPNHILALPPHSYCRVPRNPPEVIHRLKDCVWPAIRAGLLAFQSWGECCQPQ